MLFDEIEKASDALWNLLLGILDKATLTLGDNRKVDFSRAMIFMTSNLGAAEMDSLVRPRLGFAAGEAERRHQSAVETKLNDRISRVGVEAARRKFTPEFINRIDRTVVFRALGAEELRSILAIELKAVQERILGASNSAPFVFTVTDPARDIFLREGTDLKYGARHLKRAIERHVVHPTLESDRHRTGVGRRSGSHRFRSPARVPDVREGCDLDAGRGDCRQASPCRGSATARRDPAWAGTCAGSGPGTNLRVAERFRQLLREGTD